MKNLLMPFAWLYGIITAFRNKLYDKGFLKTCQSIIPTICIGNLQVGGTGKTPHTAWIYQWLSTNFKVAILMRGYGRKTKGLIMADSISTPATIGDEAFWYYQSLPNVEVIVSEKRVKGIQFIEKLMPKIDIVLLDDAFQHRAITCKLNIILTTFDSLYIDDKMLPQGRLREWKTGEKRAQIIMVTKCPENLSLDQKIQMIQDINPFDYQHVFFTSIKYSKPFCLKGNSKFNGHTFSSIKALSGLANNDHFISLCKKIHHNVTPISFADHYDYTLNDIKSIIANLKKDEVILTTEKDAVKFSMPELKNIIPIDTVFVVPIIPQFLFNEEDKFKQVVMQELRNK